MKTLPHLIRLYKKSDQLLATGKFGEGLWPLHEASGQFLQYLIQFLRLQRGLEVGAGIGYSTAWFVSAFRQTGGHLTSFEYFLPKVDQWEKHMGQLFGKNYETLVTMIPSDFERGLSHVGRKKFDFVFFDQRKEDYFRHLNMLLPSLKKNAIIAADNAISHQAFCQDYLDFVKHDGRFESVTLPIGDGLEITRFQQ